MANTLAFLSDSSANRCPREEGLRSAETGTGPWITMEPVQGWPGFCFLLSALTSTSVLSQITHKRTRKLFPPSTRTHTRSMWPPCQVWLLQPCNLEPAFHTQLSLSFSYSFILPFFLRQSYSLALSFALILLLTTLFSAGLAGCRSVAAPKRGTLCWNSFWWN